MVVGLVPPDEERRICAKLIEYYKQIYPGVGFTMKEEQITHQDLGDVLYTFSGEETEATAAEKMRMINSAIGEGYATPIILLRKDKKLILLDGHRRARVAFSQGMGWKAFIVVPSKSVKLGIEDMIMGKIRDLYGK
ncbi:MAG: hypothetical protein U0R44_04700 [Candidatus Micrarchaeia archaeon]